MSHNLKPPVYPLRTPIMENQMEKELEHEMETGIIQGIIRFIVLTLSMPRNKAYNRKPIKGQGFRFRA